MGYSQCSPVLGDMNHTPHFFVGYFASLYSVGYSGYPSGSFPPHSGTVVPKLHRHTLHLPRQLRMAK